MFVVLIRTVLVYLILSGAMRLMGKRQIGELEVSELITTLLISELATLPIENTDIPMLYVVVPIVTLLTIEVCTAAVLLRHPMARRCLETPPSMLICRGEVRQRELIRNRLSVEELLAALRQQGVADPDEVAYAILEKNGQVSVILKDKAQPVTVGDLKGESQGKGMMHLIISDGVVNAYNMKLLKRDEAWLTACLKRYGVRCEEVFYFLCDDAGQTRLVKKEDK